jgi:biotin carboxyl carrier protein
MKIHLKIQEKSFIVNVGDLQARPIKAEVDGETFEVWPEDMIVAKNESTAATIPAPILSQSPPAKAAESTKSIPQNAADITAPIPGVIVAVNVKAGDSVTYGQELCMLEAMKMKNAIRAGQDGVIQTVHVQAGQHVQQGQLLISFERERQM